MSKFNITFKNKKYSIDKSLLSGAISSLEDTLNRLSGGASGDDALEGSGSEFYTLAPTALTFRSTEPLNEFSEVQINGVTVDPSNYTLEEGSTIVTLPIDYLKTLDVGQYDITVVSANKAPKGNFSVKAPELNEYGFYYNQPYSAFVAYFGEDETVFIRDDGTLDIIGTPSGYISQATYTISGNNINIVSPIAGVLNGTISADGSEIFINELATNFKLSSNDSIAADEDYIYIYKEDLGGYEVTAIDKTKAEYGAIKTGINGIDTVKLEDKMFFTNYDITVAPKIPDGVVIIGYAAFCGCSNLRSVTLSNTITTIGDEAFYGCTNLTDVTIGTSVTSIGEKAFGYCESLNELVLPNSVITIIEGAFLSCKNLKIIRFDGTLEQWCSINFETSSGHSGTNPCGNNDAQLYIDGNLVDNIKISGEVLEIKDRAFFSCNSLISVNILSGVVNIGSYAFYECTSLESIIIPDGVTSIGLRAFENCTSLESITFNGTIEQWNAITKSYEWNSNVPATHVQCTDGPTALDGTEE